jgi:hypothetical protein
VLFHIGCINFRHDERDIRVHAEGAGIINDYATGLRGDRSEFLRDAAAGTEECDVDAFESVFGEFPHRQLRALERHRLARRTGRGKQGQFADGKFTLFQRLDHFHADSARRADHSNMGSAVHKRGGNIRASRKLSTR